MELQKFLREHADWEEILGASPYSLTWKRDNGYILFKYNQVESDFTIPLVREARGIIFEEKTWEAVCIPFYKFGNYGEGYVEPLDWKSGVSVQEKVDGSLMKVWFHNGWHLSTNGMIDAFKTETGSILYPTFGTLFERALKEYGFNCGWGEKENFNSFCKLLNPYYTYMFELATEENKVVIPYKGFHIFYLGQRDKEVFIEGNRRDLFERIVEVPKIYPMDSLESVQGAAASLPYDEEGYVVVDKDWKRCKIKSPAYVRAHYVVSNNILTRRRAVDILLKGEKDEFLIYAPEKEEVLFKVEYEMGLLREICFDSLKHVFDCVFTSRAEYAQIVNKCIKFPIAKSFCFMNYDKETSWEEFIARWTPEKWEKILESLD